jgi:acetyl esterase/lipase
MRPRSARLDSLRPSFDPLESRQLLAANLVSNNSNLVYTTDASGPQRLDVNLPSGEAPAGGWPVVIAIHGGGWRGGDKTSYEDTVDTTLLAAGFAVVAPDYTLSKPGHSTWPVNLNELRQAVRWVKAESSKFDFNPSEVAAMGDSAGANLALLLGTDPAGARTEVNAVVDFYGPTNLATLERESAPAAPAVTQFLGGTPSRVPSKYAAASPITHVSASSPPVLIVQGTADQVVPLEQSVELDQVLNSHGVANQFITIDGAPHGFGLEVNGVDLGPSVVDFLRQTLESGAV